MTSHLELCECGDQLQRNRDPRAVHQHYFMGHLPNLVVAEGNESTREKNYRPTISPVTVVNGQLDVESANGFVDCPVVWDLHESVLLNNCAALDLPSASWPTAILANAVNLETSAYHLFEAFDGNTSVRRLTVSIQLLAFLGPELVGLFFRQIGKLLSLEEFNVVDEGDRSAAIVTVGIECLQPLLESECPLTAIHVVGLTVNSSSEMDKVISLLLKFQDTLKDFVLDRCQFMSPPGCMISLDPVLLACRGLPLLRTLSIAPTMESTCTVKAECLGQLVADALELEQLALPNVLTDNQCRAIGTVCQNRATIMDSPDLPEESGYRRYLYLEECMRSLYAATANLNRRDRHAFVLQLKACAKALRATEDRPYGAR